MVSLSFQLDPLFIAALHTSHLSEWNKNLSPSNAYPLQILSLHTVFLIFACILLYAWLIHKGIGCNFRSMLSHWNCILYQYRISSTHLRSWHDLKKLPTRFMTELLRNTTGDKKIVLVLRQSAFGHCRLENSLAWYQAPVRERIRSPICSAHAEVLNVALIHSFYGTPCYFAILAAWVFKACHLKEIFKLLRSSKSLSTVCLGSPWSPVLKFGAIFLMEVMTEIVIKSLGTSTIPVFWKSATLVPIPEHANLNILSQQFPSIAGAASVHNLTECLVLSHLFPSFIIAEFSHKSIRCIWGAITSV